MPSVMIKLIRMGLNLAMMMTVAMVTLLSHNYMRLEWLEREAFHSGVFLVLLLPKLTCVRGKRGSAWLSEMSATYLTVVLE